MSIAEKLQQNSHCLHVLDSDITSLAQGVSARDILDDPAFHLETPNRKDSLSHLQSLSIYQLNAKSKDLEQAGIQLHELWITKSLYTELNATLDLLLEGSLGFDKQGLDSALDNLKKFHQKLKTFSEAKLAIVSVFNDLYEKLLMKFSSAMRFLFRIFIPETAVGSFAICRCHQAGDAEMNLHEFFDLVHTYESYTSTSPVTDLLNTTKSAWEKDLLEPLISTHCFSRYTEENRLYCISTVTVADAGGFHLGKYFESLRNFVSFVNATTLQSLKNYYSTKISNSLVDVISQNIHSFMNDQVQLTEDLMQTINTFAQSGWAIPIRNVFVSQENINKSIHDLYMNWTLDKYINEIRTVFTSPEFELHLKTHSSIEKTIQMVAPAPAAPQPISDASNDLSSQAADNASDELDWNENWGSETDEEQPQPQPKRNSTHSASWDNSWDEEWDDDDNEDSFDDTQSNAKASKQNRTLTDERQYTTRPADTFVSAESNSVPTTRTLTFTITQSSVPGLISKILQNFEKQTEGADNRDLLDSVFAMASVSYPPLSRSFLLYNDLTSIECGNEYLTQLANAERNNFYQKILKQVTAIISKVSFDDADYDESSADGVAGTLTEIGHIISSLFDNELPSTNEHELRGLLIQISNLMNTLILKKIFGSDEITEYLSEEYTQFLESLQTIEEDTLSRVKENSALLATMNKVMQTKFLLNNHLKNIMESFYQGELYEFSTEELVSLIKGIFIPSDLRESCIREIKDIRDS